MAKRTCEATKKHIHESKDKAYRHQVHMRMLTRENFDIYRCDSCGGWHVGHAMRKRKATG